ncbi:hypothetical protein ACWDYH_31375 [Nocardia goodfellowii]
MATEHLRLVDRGGAQICIGPAPLTATQRSAGLEERIVWLQARTSCTVQDGGDFSAVVVLSGPPPNHLLHAALTLTTAGGWGLIWLWLAAHRRPYRVRLTVDEAGIVRGVPVRR